MTYRKPELHGYPATSVVQSTDKDEGLAESQQQLFTAPAYEADE
jgi:hypothetical protein